MTLGNFSFVSGDVIIGSNSRIGCQTLPKDVEVPATLVPVVGRPWWTRPGGVAPRLWREGQVSSF